jgi:Mrp family chromosome partitioning ATPase
MSRNFELLLQAEQLLGAAVPKMPRAAVDREETHAAAASVADLDEPGHEEMLRLVQQVFFSANGSAPRQVVFCGVDNDEGSSLICQRTGRVLAAQTSRPVCIADASRRSRSARGLFEVGPGPFIVEAGRSAREQCRKLGENLWLAPASALETDNGSASVSDLRLRLEALRREFDYVLVDAPPAALYSHTALLGQAADGIVLVLEANATRRIAAKKVKETLEGSSVRLLGTVLNNRTFPVPEKLYRRL